MTRLLTRELTSSHTDYFTMEDCGMFEALTIVLRGQLGLILGYEQLNPAAEHSNVSYLRVRDVAATPSPIVETGCWKAAL